VTEINRPYRIQKKGDRTMLVSLPKHYVHTMGLNVGDELWAYVDGGRLVLTPNRLDREEVDESVGPHESNREARAREREYLSSR